MGYQKIVEQQIKLSNNHSYTKIETEYLFFSTEMYIEIECFFSDSNSSSLE